MNWRNIVRCDICGEGAVIQNVHFQYGKKPAAREVGLAFTGIIYTIACPKCGQRLQARGNDSLSQA
jgi:hypothetical protein